MKRTRIDGEPTLEQLVEIFINHIKLLEPAREDNSYSPPPFQPSQALPESTYSAAFEGDYIDPHGLIPHYCREISAMMEAWVNNPKKYVAPYTSVVTSSMMGKSRLIKELAMDIPTVYICLRNDTNDSGYPIASNQCLVDYVFHNTVKKDDENPEATAVKHFQRLLLCFMRLLRKFSKNWKSDNSSENTKTMAFTPASTRTILWYLLAEPNTEKARKYMTEVFLDSNQAPQEVWEMVLNSINTDDEDINRALAKEWKVTSKYLAQHSTDGKPLLLIVWDEARALVEAGIDGKTRRQESSISKFRLLRRALGSIGKINSESPIRIFTLFTDTTSRITNFQPALRSSYTNRRLSDIGDRRLFDPIVIMPTWDYHAKCDLNTTIDPERVAQTKRLIRFGRSAWYSLWSNTESAVSSDMLIKIAIEKLMLTTFDKDLLSAKFDSSSPLDEPTRLAMLAVLGCRLAIQTGSYVSLVHELVASHMMVLLRIVRHEQVEAIYPSEPMLAVASYLLTAQFGWVRPLQTLITSLRHGIVGKGFRGEFVTKVLLCMAMEDALRIVYDQKGTDDEEDEEETLFQFRPVSTNEFLSSLLCYTGLGQDPDTETPGDNNETIQEFFDDWDSDEDDIPRTTEADGDPDPEDANFFDAVVKEIQGWNPLRKSPRHAKTDAKTEGKASQKKSAADKIQEKVRTIADGSVFFNHFECLNTKLRPSILIKAWNKGAALMTKANTPGIDFVIPVLLKKDDTENVELGLGPLSGEWTLEEEKRASSIIAYILIDAKNDLSMTNATIQKAAEKCRPTNHNFLYHKQSNPFISFVPSYGSTPFPDGPVKIFRSPQSELSGNQPLQLKIGARGISADTYKCLQNRPNTERLLNQLLQMNRNPLRELSGRRNKEVRNGIIDCLSLQCDPRREFAFTEQDE